MHYKLFNIRILILSYVFKLSIWFKIIPTNMNICPVKTWKDVQNHLSHSGNENKNPSEFHFISTKVDNNKPVLVGRRWRNYKLQTLLEGKKNGSAALETSFVIPSKC